MGSENSLRWQKVLWAVVIIFALALTMDLRYNAHSIIAFSAFPYFIWPYVIALSMIVILLRLVGVVSKESFIYILIGTLNLTTGIIGEILLIRSSEELTLAIRSMFLVNLLAGVLIFWDVFRK